MRRRDPRRGWAARPLVAIIAISLIGAGPAKKKRSEPPPPKVEETVSDLAYVVSAGETKLEGVGLVVGLDNTGADPPPSYYREKLLDEMRKAGVEDANRVLADKTTAMVIVRVKIPTGITTKDRMDVELELLPASGTTSLAGGYLMPTRLREMMIAGGAPKEGPEFATAQGAVMVGTGAKPGSLKDGRVLGGARCKKDIPFSLILKDSRKSIKTAAMLQKVVNERFHQSEGKDQKAMATAKTDQFLELQVPRVYHNNQGRYFQVVKLLPMVDSPEFRAQRTERWAKELLDPKTSGVAALRLEGLGLTAIEALKAGLASPNTQVRFWAAEALATSTSPGGSTCWATPPPITRSSAPSPWRRWRRWTSRPRT
ncbi:MAG: flagellar basal body P-ring protein FlgI [Singulisphaera sp.]